ncbi:MAG TPA: carbamoyltransferase C-terminal domain-containing protein [Puia sp.]
MKRHTYVLGTGLSHDGSACLLKDGDICVAIEKERLSRVKHDGFNDSLAIKYCLQAEGITVHDLDLVVQSALMGGTFDNGNSFFAGERIFTDDIKVPIVTISHHLAHAYSAIGRCPFENDFNILIIDGSGSPFIDCNDIADAFVPDRDKIHQDVAHLYYEKDSYYNYAGNKLTPVYKDFASLGYFYKFYPAEIPTAHSIGGLFRGVSNYCFRNAMDAGKLMGLAPYGSPGVYKEEIFELKDGRAFINYDWIRKLTRPARSHEEFKKNFKYYADIAYRVQEEVGRAVIYVINERSKLNDNGNLCYAGGVALNAVANNLILSRTNVKRLYIQPAAGDNGVSIGCAYYGWLQVLGKERCVKENNTTCFGITYPEQQIEHTLRTFENKYHPDNLRMKIDHFFKSLEENYNSANMKSASAVIEIDIKDYCKYQIIGLNDRIECKRDSLLPPSCTVELDEIQLATIIQDPTYMNTLWEANRIKISNYKELFFFFAGMADLFKVSKDNGMSNGMVNRNILDKFVYTPDYIERTAALLAEGKVIAWFQDGSEFGPRALGRRSILADPRIAGVRDYINTEIKFREDFRPFAPAVLREDVSTYFENDRESPYMILVDYARKEWHDKIPSIVHRNNTSRIQTVTADWNLRFYKLLKAFKEITGISVLLNTSLNRRGMPIVESPQDALDFFYSCKLDYLVLDKFIISK